MSRREKREKIIIIIYQILMYEKNKMNYKIDDVILENDNSNSKYIKEIVNGIMDKKEEIINIADENLKDWTMDRLSIVDKAILLSGIYELIYYDTPKIVAINEAIELSKKYSDDKVVKMINGVLDSIRLKYE